VEATAASAGIGLLPCFLAEPHPGLVRVLGTLVRFELNFSLSVRPPSRDLEAVTVIREAILAEIAGRRDELVPAR
jgi:DNA-binding transcriptional LysR family regulator